MKRTADSPLGVWLCVWQRKETNLKAYGYVFVHYNNTQTHRFTHTHTHVYHMYLHCHICRYPQNYKLRHKQTFTQSFKNIHPNTDTHMLSHTHTHADLWHYAVSRTTGYVKKQKDQGNKKNMKSYKSVAPHEIAVEVR